MTIWLTIGGVAAATMFVKAFGPVVVGGRELPPRFAGVITLMAPALLAALVVTSALSDGDRWRVGADSIGVLAAGLAVWRGASAILAVAIAVLVTAGLRLAGLP